MNLTRDEARLTLVLIGALAIGFAIWRLSRSLNPPPISEAGRASLAARLGFKKRRTFASLREFYAEVESLAVALEQAGQSGLARQLRKCMFEVVVTTSSELLGNLVPVLRETVKETDGELKRRARDCRHFAVYHRRILGLS